MEVYTMAWYSIYHGGSCRPLETEDEDEDAAGAIASLATTGALTTSLTSHP